jgi:hypothetical protein
MLSGRCRCNGRSGCRVGQPMHLSLLTSYAAGPVRGPLHLFSIVLPTCSMTALLVSKHWKPESLFLQPLARLESPKHCPRHFQPECAPLRLLSLKLTTCLSVQTGLVCAHASGEEDGGYDGSTARAAARGCDTVEVRGLRLQPGHYRFLFSVFCYSPLIIVDFGM